MLDDPARIDAHVVGDHVAGQPDPARPGPVAQVGVGRLAAEIGRDPVVVERVRRGDRVGVAAHPLDPLRRTRPLPQADQPQPGDAPAGELVELRVGDRVERPDVAAVGSRQLVQPDIGALGDQHDPRHPGRIGRERLRLIRRRRPEHRSLGAAARPTAPIAATTEPQVERALLLGKDADGEIETPDERVETGPEEDPPGRLDEPQLAGQRGGCLAGGQAHELEQREAVPVDRRPTGEGGFEALDRILVASAFRERPIVDELLERADRGVLVGDARQQQLLEAVLGRLRLRPAARELLAEAVEQALGVVPPEVRLQAGQRGGHRARLAFRLVARDEQVADLVQQTQRADVTGLDRRLVQRPGAVHPARQAAHARQVGDDQIAAGPEQWAADAVSLARLAPDVELAHQRSIACRVAARPGRG